MEAFFVSLLLAAAVGSAGLAGLVVYALLRVR